MVAFDGPCNTSRRNWVKNRKAESQDSAFQAAHTPVVITTGI
jgi:hypothetical protein